MGALTTNGHISAVAASRSDGGVSRNDVRDCPEQSGTLAKTTDIRQIVSFMLCYQLRASVAMHAVVTELQLE